MLRPTLYCCFAVVTFLAPASIRAAEAKPTGVAVEILENIQDKKEWAFAPPKPTTRYSESAFGFVAVPTKYSAKGQILDRSNPYVLRAAGEVKLAAGEYRFLLRSRNAARLFIDDQLVVQTQFIKANAGGHEAVPELPASTEKGLRSLQAGHQEKLVTVKLTEGVHQFRLEGYVGGQKLRLELGELVVGVASKGEPFHILSGANKVPLSDEGWLSYAASCQERHRTDDTVARKAAAAEESRYWRMRHELARQELKDRPAPKVPEVSARTPVHNAIDQFIGKKLEERQVAPAPLCDDLTFLRRATLDIVGVVPTRQEIDAFLRDQRPDRRARVIDRLLVDPRWADHWVGYWQDVLAENPGILKPTLNNTGPFRWWLHQVFLDELPMDRFVTELVLMEGSKMGGGPGGFALATQNDVPMASKGHILARAFLGIELSCARCHDAPLHPYRQKDTFSLAAMLAKGSQTVPITSSVKPSEGSRRPLIQVTLQPGTAVDAAWPFPDIAPAKVPAGVLRGADDSRERLAAILTSPHNQRFAEVMANRLWQRYLGWGLVEPVDDWHNAEPSHPELLRFLAHEFVTHDYDLKHLARLILGSHTYQRTVQAAEAKVPDAKDRLFASPARRRMTAEQLLDSLFLVAGKEFHSEELCMDPEGRRPITEMINLGTPRRAWEFTSLSNERDRPALALPAAQSAVDVLSMFGWRDSRQNPITVRDETATPLQPLILANGIVGSRITRLSDDSSFTDLCLKEMELTELVRAVFLQVLSRPPSQDEQALFAELLKDGYADRRLAGFQNVPKRKAVRATAVSWANHLSPEATRIKLELERQARDGDPPTVRLRKEWRERMEDMLWSLINSPEFIFVP